MAEALGADVAVMSRRCFMLLPGFEPTGVMARFHSGMSRAAAERARPLRSGHGGDDRESRPRRQA
ncbi:MAG: hypothetical protein R3C04_07300 [Hyphomonas sp.]